MASLLSWDHLGPLRRPSRATSLFTQQRPTAFLSFFLEAAAVAQARKEERKKKKGREEMKEEMKEKKGREGMPWHTQQQCGGGGSFNWQ
jgi:hypothetical protein